MLSGLAALQRTGRYGGWVIVQQQVTGAASNGTAYRGLLSEYVTELMSQSI